MTEEFVRPWLAEYGDAIPETVPEWTKPLYDLMDTVAHEYPDREALIYEDTPITFSQLLEQAENFAGALKRRGFQCGQSVAIMLPNLPQTVIAFWGIIKAGGVVVMTNPLYREKELVNNMNDSGAEYIILQADLWAKVDSVRAKTPLRTFIVTNMEKDSVAPIPYDDESVLSWQAFTEAGFRYSEAITDAEAPVLLQYTGGTTGTPKGVILTHRNLGANALQILNFLNLLPRDHHVILGILPFFHVYGLTVCLVMSMISAATLLPLPKFDPRKVLQTIARYKPTFFPGAPAMYHTLLQQKEIASYDLKSIRICMSGSAPLPREIFNRFQQVTGASILEAYGLTEASPVTHVTKLGMEGVKVNSIGIPLPATDARIVDMEVGSLTLEPGQLGELVIRGPQVMKGYWHKDDETANALRNEWLYTGDIARMDENGYFYIVDRKKDMVIVGGYNVYPREVDEVLLEHPKILEAVCVGLADDMRGEVLRAYIVLRPGEQLTKSEVVGWCRKKLASYKVPRQVEFRDSLPKSIVGKILRQRLREEEDRKRAANTDRA